MLLRDLALVDQGRREVLLTLGLFDVGRVQRVVILEGEVVRGLSGRLFIDVAVFARGAVRHGLTDGRLTLFVVARALSDRVLVRLLSAEEALVTVVLRPEVVSRDGSLLRCLSVKSPSRRQ